MRYFFPHFKRAIRLHREFSQIDLERRGALSTLDSIRLGIAIIRRQGEVLFINAAGRELCGRRDGLTYFNQALHIENSAARRDFEQAVMSVIDAAQAGRAITGRTVLVRRAAGQMPYSLLVSSLWGNLLRAQHTAFPEPLAVVFFTDPDARNEPRVELLQQLYGLTPTETRVLSALVEGKSLPDIAKKMRVAENTTRVHLKSILRKTNTHRQSDLVRLVIASPEWMLAPSFSAQSS